MATVTPLSDLLSRLEPLQQHAVRLVYFEDKSAGDAARLLAVERAVLLAALAVAFRRLARWVLDDVESASDSASLTHLVS